MTVADFKDTVAGYLNRTAASVVSAGSLDLILAAMNDARRAAQRDYIFEMNKQHVFVQLSLLGSSLLTDFDLTPSGTACVVRRVDGLWEYSTATVGASTAYYRTKKLDFRHSAMLHFSLPVQSSDDVTLDQTDDYAYQVGQKIYHSNLTTATWFMADAVVVLEDLAVGGTPDIFLTYFVDWLKFATLANIYTWVKDTEQATLSASIAAGLWPAVKQFDAGFTGGGSISLD